MKLNIILAFLFMSFIAGCKKDHAGCNEPTASFKINNETNNSVLEGKLLQLVNQSENAVSYKWDFGNGTTSDKPTPEFYFPMHGEYDITLTVTGKKGKTSSFTYHVTVLCSIVNPNHNPLTAPVM